MNCYLCEIPPYEGEEPIGRQYCEWHGECMRLAVLVQMGEADDLEYTPLVERHFEMGARTKPNVGISLAPYGYRPRGEYYRLE